MMKNRIKLIYLVFISLVFFSSIGIICGITNSDITILYPYQDYSFFFEGKPYTLSA